MSSLEALWGFFAGSKGLIVPSTAAVPGSKACTRLSLYSLAAPPHCPRPWRAAGRGRRPEGTQTLRWEPGPAAPASCRASCRESAPSKTPTGGYFAASSSPRASQGRGRKSSTSPRRVRTWRECGAGLLLSLQLKVPSPWCSPARGSCQWM